MEFGITKEQRDRTSKVGGLLGSALLVAAGLGMYWGGNLHSPTDILRLVPWALGIGLLLPVAVSVGGLLRIRAEGREVVQLVGSKAISRRSLDDLVSADLNGRLFPVTLKFRDGARFRLLALQIRDRQRLAEWLRVAVPSAAIE
jgi:hypothetical protein